MFSGLDTAQQNPTRRWTAAVSFTLQAALLAAALVIPLLKPQSLPEVFIRRCIFVPMSNGDSRVPPSHSSVQSAGAAHLQPLLVNNSTFSFHRMQNESVKNGSPQAPQIPGDIGIGADNGVERTIVSGLATPIPHPPIATVHPPRISAMMQGNLTKRVEPEYPPIAKQAGIQGSVVIKAIISREGTIERAELVSGSPLLARVALEAVRQWRYRPYYLNDQPVEVETQITVNFVLNR